MFVARLGRHRFVPARVEFLVLWVEHFQAVRRQHLQRLLAHQFHALEGIRGFIGIGRRKRLVHRIQNLDQVAHQRFQRELARLGHLALQALLAIVHVGLQPQHRFLHPCQFMVGVAPLARALVARDLRFIRLGVAGIAGSVAVLVRLVEMILLVLIHCGLDSC